MKTLKKVLLGVFSLACVGLTAAGLSACQFGLSTSKPGKSAYEIWLANGYSGTQADFLLWLQGEKGAKGDQGEQGIQGDKGDQGDKGEQGVGIERIECDEEGNFVIIYTDGTTQTVVVPEKETHIHEWGDGIVLKESTYADNGVMICVCACGEAKYEVIPALDASEGLSYLLNADGKSYAVDGIGNCMDTEIIIPSKFAGLPVTSIGEDAFSSCNDLISVILPDSVTSIENGAFSWCRNLTSIVLPNRITRINERVFYSCESLMSVTIPEGVTSIERDAFSECQNLQNAVIPNTVEKIGDFAFNGCRALRSVVIPNGVMEIGCNAFSNCENLVNVSIPNSVTRIGSSAFEHTGLMSTPLPNSVTTIENNTFANCEKLMNVVIPNWVTRIAGGAFERCAKLMSVVIPDNVSVIEGNAFSNCESLSNVVIGSGVTEIGGAAFANNKNLVKFTVSENNVCYKDIDGNLYSKDGTTLVQYATGKMEAFFTIPNEVVTIGEHAFSGSSNLTSIIIPDSVITISWSVFDNCSGLTNVVIGTNVTSIDNHAFSWCVNLTGVYYKGSISDWSEISIGDWGNDYLTSATRYYYSESEPTEEGNYWHYDENGEVAVW